MRLPPALGFVVLVTYSTHALSAQQLQPTQSQAPPEPHHTSSLSIAIEQPAYGGQPIWVRLVSSPTGDVHYPFSGAVDDIGCNHLDVEHDGILMKPVLIQRAIATTGPPRGSSAPQDSPSNRLPLHALYRFKAPGIYSVRWTTLPSFPAMGGTADASSQSHSDWLTFRVMEATSEEHEAWINSLIANPPSDVGHLAGNFLPSLLAAARDPRALETFVKYLYADNSMVSGIAASALDYFPQQLVLSAVTSALEKQGPSEQLAYFATFHTGWRTEDEVNIVHSLILIEAQKFGGPLMRPLPPYAPTHVSAAIKLLRFIFYVPNQAWPSNSELAAYADDQVLLGAPSIMAEANMNAVQELADYLGSMSSSTRTHELLLQIAERTDNAGVQARVYLTRHS